MTSPHRYDGLVYGSATVAIVLVLVLMVLAASTTISVIAQLIGSLVALGAFAAVVFWAVGKLSHD